MFGCDFASVAELFQSFRSPGERCFVFKIIRTVQLKQKCLFDHCLLLANFEQSARGASSEADIETHMRRSSRIKVPSNTNFESRMAERANTLKHCHSGFIATLTRIRGDIKEKMDNCGHLEDLKLNQDSYENAWRKFVKAHEEYIECLDVLARYEELDRANDSYKGADGAEGSIRNCN